MGTHLFTYRATYATEKDISDFLVNLFGDGTCTVLWKRGRWQCTLPRALTPSERAQMDAYCEKSHYSTF